MTLRFYVIDYSTLAAHCVMLIIILLRSANWTRSKNREPKTVQSTHNCVFSYDYISAWYNVQLLSMGALQ